MDEHRTKEVLDFLLNSYRAKMALQNPAENCPFDFQQFLTTWKGKYPDWATLRATMKRDLEPLQQQGIFDSIIPYLQSSMNQSVARRDELQKSGQESASIVDGESNNNGIISAELITLTPQLSKRNDKRAPSGSKELQEHIKEEEMRTEIVIHVCDEAKNLKQDFKCIQSILVQEMGYFSKVTVKGQKLKDMDISVHCDISVFDWLMKWIKAKVEVGGESNNNPAPKLESLNVIGLMVSAEFLMMPKLTSECIKFTADNIEDVILTSPNLGCLNETLTNRLSVYFDNIEMETKIGRIDKNDRITSRLYTQFTMSLNDSFDSKKEVEAISRGHFSSTFLLFKCTSCGRLLTNEVAYRVPCTSMRLDCRGRLYSNHTKDLNWSLSNFIRELKRELKSWRRVYWRLWSCVHFLPCSSCQLTFPVKDFTSCRFHPKLPQLQVSVLAATGEIQERNLVTTEEDAPGRGDNKTKEVFFKEECINPFRRHGEKQTEKNKGNLDQYNEADVETIDCAFGVYPCCRQPGYKFYPLPATNGCKFREHIITNPTLEMEPILKRIALFKDLIIVSPTKDKDKDPTMPSKKGATFEWGSIVDLTPPKPTASSSSLNSLQQKRYFKPDQLPTCSSAEESNNSNSLSETEDNNDIGEGGSGNCLGKSSTNPASSYQHRGAQSASDFWSWNSDFTTRYNQDMQREKEEKLMTDLELLLSQRASLEPSSTSMRFGYLSRRTHKNVGGSFIKLEEKWREEQQRGGGGGGGGNKGANQRATTKSAKP